MTKYCDVHGAVEVAEDTTACTQCQTLLKAAEADMEINRRGVAIAPAPTLEPGVITARPKSRIICEINALLAELAES